MIVCALVFFGFSLLPSKAFASRRGCKNIYCSLCSVRFSSLSFAWRPSAAARICKTRRSEKTRNVPHRAHQRKSNAAHYSNRYLIFSHSRLSGRGKKSVYALCPVSLSIEPRLPSRTGARVNIVRASSSRTVVLSPQRSAIFSLLFISFRFIFFFLFSVCMKLHDSDFENSFSAEKREERKKKNERNIRDAVIERSLCHRVICANQNEKEPNRVNGSIKTKRTHVLRTVQLSMRSHPKII